VPVMSTLVKTLLLQATCSKIANCGQGCQKLAPGRHAGSPWKTTPYGATWLRGFTSLKLNPDGPQTWQSAPPTTYVQNNNIGIDLDGASELFSLPASMVAVMPHCGG